MPNKIAWRLPTSMSITVRSETSSLLGSYIFRLSLAPSGTHRDPLLGVQWWGDDCRLAGHQSCELGVAGAGAYRAGGI